MLNKESVKDRSTCKQRFWNTPEVQNFLKKEIKKAYPKEFLPVWLTDLNTFYNQMASELFKALWKELEKERPCRPDCFTCFEFDFSMVPIYIWKRGSALSDKFGSEFVITDDVWDAYSEL
jgi:hypothetical protein